MSFVNRQQKRRQRQRRRHRQTSSNNLSFITHKEREREKIVQQQQRRRRRLQLRQQCSAKHSNNTQQTALCLNACTKRGIETSVCVLHQQQQQQPCSSKSTSWNIYSEWNRIICLLLEIVIRKSIHSIVLKDVWRNKYTNHIIEWARERNENEIFTDLAWFVSLSLTLITFFPLMNGMRMANVFQQIQKNRNRHIKFSSRQTILNEGVNTPKWPNGTHTIAAEWKRYHHHQQRTAHTSSFEWLVCRLEFSLLSMRHT